VAVVSVDAQVDVRITDADGVSNTTRVTIPRNGTHVAGSI
jgi:hypothetical protein